MLMPTLRGRWSLVFLVSAAICGCSSTNFVEEHPVENQVPPLKAGVYAVNAVDVRPVPTHQFEPDYPFELESILTGKAVVVFTVKADGKVADPLVVEADDVLFGEAAVAAIKKWKFRAAQVKGAPVDCRMTMPFIFVSPYANNVPGETPDAPSDRAPASGSNQGTIEPR